MLKSGPTPGDLPAVQQIGLSRDGRTDGRHDNQQCEHARLKFTEERFYGRLPVA